MVGKVRLVGVLLIAGAMSSIPNHVAGPPVAGATGADESCSMPTGVAQWPVAAAQSAVGRRSSEFHGQCSKYRSVTALPNPLRYETWLAVPGDTLASIAAGLGSTPEAIADLNHIAPTQRLREGRPLVVPVFTGSAHGVGGLTVTRANTAAPKVALTFDTERLESDPAAVYAILDVLREHDVRATFFLCGNWTTDFPAIVQAIVADGHEIGNHSMTHPDFTQLSTGRAVAEIHDVEQLVRQSTGTSPLPYFRFPFGASTEVLTDLLARNGYIAYFWTAGDAGIDDWLDSVRADRDEGNGAILLLHTQSDNAAALGGWIDEIRVLGLQPTSLVDALN